jgi:CMP-N-acetylneuraminic acid synthetase
MKTIGIITARGGSKGIPGKNIKLFAGKPLIAWTIEAARSAYMLDYVIVSTDSHEIAAVARQYKADVPFIRPGYLAKDDTPHIDVILHALDEIGYDRFTHCCLLQPTSPLRTSDDIDEACILASKRKSKTVVSVSENRQYPLILPSAVFGYLIRPRHLKQRYLPRQAILPRSFINGAIYVNTIEQLLKKRSVYSWLMCGYPMPLERSMQIDTQLDFDIAEYLMIKTIDAKEHKTEAIAQGQQIQSDFLFL